MRTRSTETAMSDSAENDVSLAIKAQNPDLETAWRTIAWWEQTCAYWRGEAYKVGELRRRSSARARCL